jgi:hypothetical protein
MYTHQQTQMQYCKQAILNQNICNGNQLQKFHDQMTLKHSRVQLARQIAQATRLLQEAPMLQEKEARGNYRRNKVRGDVTVTNGKVQRQINKQKIHQRHRQEKRNVSGEHPKKTRLEYYVKSKKQNSTTDEKNCQNCQMCHKKGNKKGKRHQGAGQMQQQKRRKSRGTGQMQQKKFRRQIKNTDKNTSNNRFVTDVALEMKCPSRRLVGCDG